MLFYRGKWMFREEKSNFFKITLLGAGASLESWDGPCLHFHVLDTSGIREARNGHTNYVFILKYLLTAYVIAAY